MFPNNKLWLSKELKGCLNERKTAFLNGDAAAFYGKRRELRSKIKRAKTEFKNKVESQFCRGNRHQAWEGLNKMMGRAPQGQAHSCLVDSLSFANNLNHSSGL